MSNKEIKLRSADEDAHSNRKSIEDIFPEYETEKQFTGALEVRDLPEGLFAYFGTEGDTADAARATRAGYIPLENVETELGTTIDGIYNNGQGSGVKIWVCSAKSRERRHKERRDIYQKDMQATYGDDSELPMNFDRDKAGLRPPSHYNPTEN